MEIEDAEEYTQALGQVSAGGWRQILLGVKLGVPDTLGLSTEEWVNGRLGGYVRLSLPDRREAAAELAAEGKSVREAAEILGVSRETVRRDLKPDTDVSGDAPVAPDDQHEVTPPDTDVSGEDVPEAAEPDPESDAPEVARPVVSLSATADERRQIAEEERRREAEADRRVRHTQSFARSVVALWSLLDPDPVAFLGHTWDPESNPHRSTSASEAFTARGLRLIAERLAVLAERAEQSGGHL